jgi:hypothetical protein
VNLNSAQSFPIVAELEDLEISISILIPAIEEQNGVGAKHFHAEKIVIMVFTVNM